VSGSRVAVVAAETSCCPSVVEAPLSETEAESMARVYAALGDPVRLRLLSLIAAAGELCSCDMVEPLAKSQPTVSHHTRILAEAGLISGDKRGRWVHWSITEARLDFVRRVLDL
jgi:ArsR family transcriptional regulator